MESNGKLRVELKSTKVARIQELEVGALSSGSLTSWNGPLFATKRRVVVYDYVLDEEQVEALREAREMARSSGLVLEVTDLTRQNALKRALTSGLGKIVAGLPLKRAVRLDARGAPMRSQPCPP